MQLLQVFTRGTRHIASAIVTRICQYHHLNNKALRDFPQGFLFVTLCRHCHPINRLPTWYTITATNQPMANVYSAIKTGQRADFVSLATMASVAAQGV